MVFEWFKEHLPHLQFKVGFLPHCSFQCPEFKNIYTLTTSKKRYKNQEKMNNVSHTCQDESGLLRMNIYIYIYIYMCVYIYIYIYVYIYIYL